MTDIVSRRERPAALVIAHPGHELRVHHWLEFVHPIVFVLTDGSGHRGASRLATTSRIIDRAQARAGSIYGRLTDRELYDALIGRDADLFQQLAGELAEALVSSGVELVASDAIEGYNPGHDICRHLAGAAIRMANATASRAIAGYDFLLVGRPGSPSPAEDAEAIRLMLDDAALERKIAAARSYMEIAGDVNAALAEHGPEAFRIECLRPMTAVDLSAGPAERPFYEQHGARRVEGGHYAEVIRFADHLRPIAAALDAPEWTRA